MRIGIFDSGLGGLLICHSLVAALPDYDYVYLGDTKRVPYGNRSQEAVFEFTCQAAQYLFEKEDCQLIIVACNTASAEALRKVQEEWLPQHFPERRVLGVIVPTVEALGSLQEGDKVGILATTSTVNSQAYPIEIAQRFPSLTVIQQAAPLLVPLIEHKGLQWAGPILDHYLEPLRDCAAIVLGCTHYAAIKDMVAERLPHAQIIAQDELIPASFKQYLGRHPETEILLGRGGGRHYLVTDLTENLPHFNSVDISLTEIAL